MASLDALNGTPGLAVVDETQVAVQLCVLGVPGSHLDRARELQSHPVALAQIGRWLAVHPQITPRAAHDTAGAARLIAERQDQSLLALASAVCAKHYGLVILAHDVQDVADNVTRFVLVERSATNA